MEGSSPVLFVQRCSSQLSVNDAFFERLIWSGHCLFLWPSLLEFASHEIVRHIWQVNTRSLSQQWQASSWPVIDQQQLVITATFLNQPLNVSLTGRFQSFTKSFAPVVRKTFPDPILHFTTALVSSYLFCCHFTGCCVQKLFLPIIRVFFVTSCPGSSFMLYFLVTVVFNRIQTSMCASLSRRAEKYQSSTFQSLTLHQSRLQKQTSLQTVRRVYHLGMKEVTWKFQSAKRKLGRNWFACIFGNLKRLDVIIQRQKLQIVP